MAPQHMQAAARTRWTSFSPDGIRNTVRTIVVWCPSLELFGQPVHQENTVTVDPGV
jgi:hypothetical protein